MNIYVGNLAYTSSEQELKDVFSEYGEVASVRIMMDKETGRSRGFAFVEMPNDDEARTAIEQTDGKEVGGRALRVNQAREREQRESRGGYGNRGGQGGGGNRGGYGNRRSSW